jgi:hypothetical protein
MSATPQRAPDKGVLSKEQVTTVMEALLELEKRTLSDEEREQMYDLLGEALIALGLSTRDRLPAMYDGIAALANEASSKRRIAGSLRELIKRDMARDLQKLEAS